MIDLPDGIGERARLDIQWSELGMYSFHLNSSRESGLQAGRECDTILSDHYSVAGSESNSRCAWSSIPRHVRRTAFGVFQTLVLSLVYLDLMFFTSHSL